MTDNETTEVKDRVKRTKWYAVKTVEHECDSKADMQRFLQDNKDDLPMVIRGSKLESHVEQKVVL